MLPARTLLSRRRRWINRRRVRRLASARTLYNYFRDYDPATGRYAESDPIGLDGGLNTYAYVDANPVHFADPLGLMPGDIFSTQEAAEADRAMFAALLEERQWALDVFISRELGVDEWGVGYLTGVYQVDATDETSCSNRFTYDWLPVVMGIAPTPGRGLGGNPFKGKSALEIDEMFRAKGFQPKGPNPMGGQGSYVNPRTGRGYHIDARHGARPPYPKGPHVGVHRPRNMRDVLPPRDYPMGGGR